MLLGAGFLLGVDTLARTAARIEIPLGVLTAFVGTPLFLGSSCGRACLAMTSSKRATSRSAIRDIGRPRVSMSVSAGEVVCLLGPNGGGKTTLFKTLLGLLRAQEGTSCSTAPTWRSRAARHRARVSYVPQAHEGYFPFTVRGRRTDGTHRARRSLRDAFEARRGTRQDALGLVGIAHLAQAIYTRISGGERQLTLIARALAQDARLMVLDEPTASLDFGNQVRVIDRVLGLAERGMGILLSTHNPDHALVCADRVLLLHGGGIARGVPDRVITPSNLRTLYGVEVDVTTLGDGRRTLCVPHVGRTAPPPA